MARSVSLRRSVPRNGSPACSKVTTANARVQSVPHKQRSNPQASNTRASGSQMSGKGYGSRDSVQAPLTLITAFGRLASSSTFGRSAQGCGGAGGEGGGKMARWSVMERGGAWGGRHARLHDPQMVDDESRVGVAIHQRGALVQVAPAQDVDRKVVANG